MKYWNKQKHTRERRWHKIVIPQIKLATASGWMPPEDWLWKRKYKSLKHNIQISPSDGKFYMSKDLNEVWFEREEDMVEFLLRRS